MNEALKSKILTMARTGVAFTPQCFLSLTAEPASLEDVNNACQELLLDGQVQAKPGGMICCQQVIDSINAEFNAMYPGGAYWRKPLTPAALRK